MNIHLIDPIHAKEILLSHGLPVNRAYPAASEEDAVSRAQRIGFPVVLKIASKKIAHKTEVGGVAIDIRDEKELIRRFRELENIRVSVDPESRISVEKMLDPGVELFAGVVNDESYGKVMLFGVGGIFVEVYGDVSYRLVPISKRDAEDMIGELKGRKLLDGVRGLPSVNREKVIEFLLGLSCFAEKERFAELDVNPIICRGDEIVAADVRIVGGR
jgi:succinyl-CoA synthetase beta subunit